MAALKEDPRLIHSADGEIAVVKASVKFLRSEPEKVAYAACPNQREGRPCHKKLEKGLGSMWRCNACSADVEVPSYRYMLSVNIQDQTGDNFVTIFNAEVSTLVDFCVQTGQ